MRVIARIARIALGCGVVLIGAGLSYGSLVLVAKPAPAAAPQQISTVPGVTLPQKAANEGKDTTPLPANTLASYHVAADNPRAIYINNINVAARLLPMGVNADDSMQAPVNIYDGGWYTKSSKPGQVGAMVIDGHASQTGTQYGLFGRLDTLKNGDIITIERGDGTRFNYIVVHTEIDAEKDVDMNKVLVPYGDATHGLTLITCTGDWTADGKTLDHRVLVFATLTS